MRGMGWSCIRRPSFGNCPRLPFLGQTFTIGVVIRATRNAVIRAPATTQWFPIDIGMDLTLSQAWLLSGPQSPPSYKLSAGSSLMQGGLSARHGRRLQIGLVRQNTLASSRMGTQQIDHCLPLLRA